MSLDVALQSVAFYVLSCSTCSKISHRRKAKAQARKERAEKVELEIEQPGLYRHPSPFSTNPYWTEEIMMGPGPPKKNDKGSSKNTSQMALNNAESSYAGSTAVSTVPSSSPTAFTEGSRISGEGWNRKRYQREDEALWGFDIQGSSQKIKDAIAKAGSSARDTAGRLLETRLNRSAPIKEESPGPYYLQAKNPPVNDLHPPVVSTQPSSRHETRWMLQPPPSAKVMEGKVRVNRSRAGSNTSSQKNTLGRQATGRLMEERMQNEVTPSRTDSRSKSFMEERLPNELTPSRTESRSKSSRSSRLRAQRRDRSQSPYSSDDSIDVPRRKRKPPPITINTPGSSSRDTFEQTSVTLKSSRPSTGTSEMRERPSRPFLSTIVSSSTNVPTVNGIDPKPLRQRSTRTTNSALNSRDPSPAHQLPPNENSTPASIPDIESKKQELTVPQVAYIQNSD
ncbi:hypothetical protein LAWI1_G007441 [Lachnellula willkommii]|uniref:Signal peptide-containing protein n=1 Tax=Lachnellula willkommii TaxID=215461 RepID=A0A559M3L9_9HELO|nr:hypothetical protein LAWI1_G007441 [Lachnellula willkommii]